MCELLIRIVDLIGDNFYKHLQLGKAGDVVHVAPDGWPWGRREITDPTGHYAVASLPNVSVTDAQHLDMWQEADPNGVGSELTRQYRGHKLDLSGVTITPGVMNKLPWTLAELQARTVVKPHVADPAHR